GDRQRDEQRRRGNELGNGAVAALERPFALDRMRKSDRIDSGCGHGFDLVANQHETNLAGDTGAGSATVWQIGLGTAAISWRRVESKQLVKIHTIHRALSA